MSRLMKVSDDYVPPTPSREHLLASRPRSGPIHLHREILTSWAWELGDGPLRVMIQILLLAEESPVDIRLKGKTFQVPRGSFVADRDWLADCAGISWQTFRKHLRVLEDREFAEVKDEKKGRVKIKIKNYAKYQTPCHAVEPSALKPRRRGARSNQSSVSFLDGLVNEAGLRGRRTGVLFKRELTGNPEKGYPRIRLQAMQRAASEGWNDADVLLWIGLYAAKYEEVFGVRPSELLGATRKEITSQRSRVGAVLKVLRQWAPSQQTTPEALLFLYLRWVFREEKRRNNWFLEHASKGKSMNRSPITIDKVFSTRASKNGDRCLLDRWWANRELKLRRISGH